MIEEKTKSEKQLLQLDRTIRLADLLKWAITLVAGMVTIYITMSTRVHRLELVVEGMEKNFQNVEPLLREANQLLIKIETNQIAIMKRQAEFQMKFDTYDQNIQDFYEKYGKALNP